VHFSSNDKATKRIQIATGANINDHSCLFGSVKKSKKGARKERRMNILSAVHTG
jgi:hypothetical protein